jgi:hypothetical protein
LGGKASGAGPVSEFFDVGIDEGSDHLRVFEDVVRLVEGRFDTQLFEFSSRPEFQINLCLDVWGVESVCVVYGSLEALVYAQRLCIRPRDDRSSRLNEW